MISDRTKKSRRGLPALARAREERSQGRLRWTSRVGSLFAASFVIALAVHWIVSTRELNSTRQQLLARQRAVVVTLGAAWFPLRDRLEASILRSASTDAPDFVSPRAKGGEFRTKPGLYLRMRVADAKDALSIRSAAADAKRDAFAACLLREPNEAGRRGDLDGGAFPEQPWNLGQAYAATRILSGAWVDAVTEADDDLRLRIFVEQLDKAVAEEIPRAVDIVKRAEFFLLVLDEDVPEAIANTDGGVLTEEALQLVPHPARIRVVDLASGEELLRLRRTGEGRVLPVGESAATSPEIRDAMTRQANNCALAWRVEEMLTPPTRRRSGRHALDVGYDAAMVGRVGRADLKTHKAKRVARENAVDAHPGAVSVGRKCVSKAPAGMDEAVLKSGEVSPKDPAQVRRLVSPAMTTGSFSFAAAPPNDKACCSRRALLS